MTRSGDDWAAEPSDYEVADLARMELIAIQLQEKRTRLLLTFYLVLTSVSIGAAVVYLLSGEPITVVSRIFFGSSVIVGLGTATILVYTLLAGSAVYRLNHEIALWRLRRPLAK